MFRQVIAHKAGGFLGIGSRKTGFYTLTIQGGTIDCTEAMLKELLELLKSPEAFSYAFTDWKPSPSNQRGMERLGIPRTASLGFEFSPQQETGARTFCLYLGSVGGDSDSIISGAEMRSSIAMIEKALA
ncbi:hypothetical protein KBC79_03975 [Candidatus Woesebacteria bacterium]|nr:hypothetical protein [Candidatus Woesebacteria bacterium]